MEEGDKSFLPSPLGRRAGDEGLREHSIFCSCPARGEWHSKTKTFIEADAAVSPHPNPLPAGEGEEFPGDLRIDEPRGLWRVSGNEPANLDIVTMLF